MVNPEFLFMIVFIQRKDANAIAFGLTVNSKAQMD